MSPETYLSPTRGSWSDLREVVESFYSALREGDGEGLAALVDQHFTPQAIVHEPDSLPYGGVHSGAEAVKALFAQLVSPRTRLAWSGVVVEQVIEAAVEPDALDHVVVAVALPPDVRALQWWTFERLKVAELRTFYWDTAALAASDA